MADPELTITVLGRPAPQGSKRAVTRGGRIRLIEMSRALPPWREAVRAEAQRALHAGHPGFPTGPVRVHLEFRLARPRAHHTPAGHPRATAPRWVTARPDLDKLCRAVLDGLVDAGALHDDAQVALLVATKTYADHADPPGARITIGTIGQETPRP